MKKFLLASAVLTIFAFSVILVQFSCSKGVNATTLPSFTKEDILVQKQWKVDQLHRVIKGVYSSYTNGGANNTGVDYDKMRFVFKKDGTGIYTNEYGMQKDMTWEFTSPDKRSITLNISGVIYPDYWQMVEISGNYLHATQRFNVGLNTDNLHSFRLMQIQ